MTSPFSVFAVLAAADVLVMALVIVAIGQAPIVIGTFLALNIITLGAGRHRPNRL